MKWKLKELNVKRVMYGEREGQYEGFIRFDDEEKQEMKLNIPDEKLNLFLILMADSINSSAKALGDKILDSIDSSERKDDAKTHNEGTGKEQKENQNSEETNNET